MTLREDAPQQSASSERIEEKRQNEADKAERQLAERERIEERRKQEDEQAQQEEDSETQARYGELDHPHELITIAEAAKQPEGTKVTFRARIHTQRRLSAKLDFLLFRAQTDSIQGVLSHTTPHMIKWVQRLPPESLVEVTGTLQKPPIDEPVRSASHSDLEVDVYSIHLVNPAHDLPFSNYCPPEALNQRLQARVLDLRHPSNNAVFRVRATILRAFRHALDERGFLEIQTPKLQPAATESGAEVFKVNYFGRRAFLAQSPQLAKQMAISGDLKKVYEIGPVFRAENSNTHRHLTEYTGLDLEMTIQQSYTEMMAVVDQTLKAIFSAIQSMPELQVVRDRWPSSDFQFLDETLVLPFTEGIQMLRDDGRDVEEEDLHTRDEIRLGELVKEKYKTDYFILDKFPASARPFYTHKAEDLKFTNSFDIFIRGQEVCTGGQRIHDAEELRENMKDAGISEDGMEEYLTAFDLGAPPHAGAGLGLERILTFFCELGDVRNACLFHRDPKSLPAHSPSLPHPEADTTKPRTSGKPEPALEDLIANYGDATNTSWLDDRFDIWRHDRTGAAVAYSDDGKFILVAGDPLCDPSQYEEVAGAFVEFVEKERRRTPIWMLVSDPVQVVLAHRGWRTMTCVEEQRVDAESHRTPKGQEVRRVEREGITIHEVRPEDRDFAARADRAIDGWKAQRGTRGKQVHLSDIKPWVDAKHRQYFAAERDNEVLALVVLARLAPRHGWQVKWALDMPGAPNGTIEVLVDRALASLGGGSVTFGAGASERLTPGAQLGGVRAKFLSRTYHAIAASLGLAKKAEFREKFGVQGESVFICYPKRGVSVMDLKRIVRFFED